MSAGEAGAGSGFASNPGIRAAGTGRNGKPLSYVNGGRAGGIDPSVRLP